MKTLKIISLGLVLTAAVLGCKPDYQTVQDNPVVQNARPVMVQKLVLSDEPREMFFNVFIFLDFIF